MTYDIIIEARIRKTIRVEAQCEDEATQLAHELFTVANTDEEENYEEYTLDVDKVSS